MDDNYIRVTSKGVVTNFIVVVLIEVGILCYLCIHLNQDT